MKKKNGFPKLFYLFMVKLVMLTAAQAVRGLANVSLLLFISSTIILRALRQSSVTISRTFPLCLNFERLKGARFLDHSGDPHTLLKIGSNNQIHRYDLELHHHRQFATFHKFILAFYPS
jgi:hypothetical protein